MGAGFRQVEGFLRASTYCGRMDLSRPIRFRAEGSDSGGFFPSYGQLSMGVGIPSHIMRTSRAVSSLVPERIHTRPMIGLVSPSLIGRRGHRGCRGRPLPSNLYR